MNKLFSIFRNTKFLALFYQVLSIVLVCTFFYLIIGNMFHNLEVRGIKTGFSFLESSAGFEILQTIIEYTQSSSNLRVFAIGIINTLIVSFLAIILATFLGLIVGIARLSSNWIISKMALVYIEIFRNIPILLQILFWYSIVLGALPTPRNSLNFLNHIFLNNRGLYIPDVVFNNGSIFIVISVILTLVGAVYLKIWAKKRQDNTGKVFPVFMTSLLALFVIPFIIFLISGRPLSLDLPVLTGFNFEGGITMIPELVALALALGVYTATYIAEAVRAGIKSVPDGQDEAAKSLGVTPGLTLKKIILPQALRVIIPPTITMYLNIVKNSSLAAAIGYPELVTVFAGTTLNVVGQAIEIIAMTMAVYLVISLSISILMNYFNARAKLKER